MIINNTNRISFTNDFMFSLVMQDEQLCIDFLKLILPEIEFTEVRLENSILELGEAEVTTQAILKFVEAAKGVRFDAYIKSEDAWAEIEMQNYKETNIGKRSRYYQSNMDMDALHKGKSYDDLPSNYVIFICTYDFMNKDEPIYFFRNIEERLGLPFGDETYKIVLNTKCSPSKVPDKLKPFYEYINNPETSQRDEFVERLDNRVNKYNTDEWRRKLMTLEELMKKNHKEGYNLGLKEGHESGLKEGHESGLKEGCEQAASKMKSEGISYEIISKCTGLTREEIDKIVYRIE